MTIFGSLLLPSIGFSSYKKVSCKSVIDSSQINQDIFTSRHYRVHDPEAPNEFYADGLVINGTLLLSINLKTPDGKRSTFLRGSEQFDKILMHFHNMGTSILKIKSVMLNLAPLQLNDNLSVLNFFSDRGEGIVDAVKNTWTGRQALRHGFTVVTVEEITYQPNGHHIDEAMFEFSKP